MRQLEIGQHRFTQVQVMDEPGEDNACHEYNVREIGDNSGIVESFARVKFQKGPVKENGVNGCFMEDLLAIVIDRLEGFQSGDFRCRENALALTKIQEAMHWLNHRTQDRQNRGVEGKNEQ